MKTLLFAGCSLVAGDEIVWDKFCDEYEISNSSYPPLYTNIYEEKISIFYHWIFKRRFNLASKCSKLLNLKKFDISAEGSSNLSIALGTIRFLENLEPSNRADIHVVVGWTEPERFVKFDRHTTEFQDITIWHVDHSSKEKSSLAKTIFANSHDMDFILDYTNNVLMLERYLNANGITYTFFRSAGKAFDVKIDFKEKIKYYETMFESAFIDINEYLSFKQRKNILYDPLNFEKIKTDDTRWFSFEKSERGWNGSSWMEQLRASKDKSFMIHKSNEHPNEKTVSEFSEVLVTQISKNLTL